MKKLQLIITFIAISIASANAQIDLKDLAGKLTSGNSAVSGIVNSVLSNGKVTVADVAGTWTSTGSAISFESEDLLKKAGGAAAASTVEGKINPYFTKAGLVGITLNSATDGNFTITLKNGKTVKGKVTQGSTDGVLNFQFGVVGSKNLGTIPAHVTRGTQLSILFNASKLISVANALAKVSGNATLGTVSSMLNSYNGLYAGFKFNKK